MIIKGYALIVLGMYFYTILTTSVPTQRYGMAFGVLLLMPIFGRVFEWF